MPLKKTYNLFFISIAMMCYCPIFSQKIDTSNNRVKTDFTINLKKIGTIKPKTPAKSRFQIGF